MESSSFQHPRTSIFTRLVIEAADASPCRLHISANIQSVISTMRNESSSSVILIDDNQTPVAIITEKDVTRRIALRLDGSENCMTVATSPIETVHECDHLFLAIAKMRRLNLHHMPVVNQQSELTGQLHLSDALASASSQILDQVDHLAHADNLDGMSKVKGYQVTLAKQLLDEDLPVHHIQHVLTDVNNDLYRRVIDLNLKTMLDEGLGEPPVPFSAIVMGSGGRGENYIYPDQDNGFILGEYPDEDHSQIDAWFIDLAIRMTNDLDQIGMPRCKGFVMASNPLWRKKLSQWRAQTLGWTRNPTNTALRFCDIFFDFKSVYGQAALSDDLRDYVTTQVAKNKRLLQSMFSDNVSQGVGLSFFNRFIVEKEDKEHRGKINLKQTGTLPLVEGIRLLSLQAGIHQTSTLERMDALHKQGVLSGEEFEELQAAFHIICRSMLKQQIADFNNGVSVSNYVSPKSLSSWETQRVKSAMKAIDHLRDKIKLQFTGDVF